MIPVSSQLLNGTCTRCDGLEQGGYNAQPPIYHFSIRFQSFYDKYCRCKEKKANGSSEMVYFIDTGVQVNVSDARTNECGSMQCAESDVSRS